MGLTSHANAKTIDIGGVGPLTTKNLTGLLAKKSSHPDAELRTVGERTFKFFFTFIQWPWLLKSLYGGTEAARLKLLDRVGLPHDAIPHLGSWKADSFLLNRIVDEIEALKPQSVVELGSGASSLIIAKALANNGGGQLVSYDQHEPFLAEMREWLAEHNLSATFHHAPLTSRNPEWPGLWYAVTDVPESIDLLVIDGPPWAVHPYVRGMAEILFSRISPGGVVLLDDAARPGERVVERRWRKKWRDFTFTFESGGSKGTLVGRRTG